jgi:pyruvate dehydrogenase E2 component (dihydrolipoamide acetyltransferase)
VAEKLAADKGIDLKDVPSEGRIMKADVEKVIPKPEAGGEERVKMTGMRKVIAKRMAESWNTCPTVTFDISVDITNMDQLRELLKKEEVPVSYTDIIAFMVARTLPEFPLVNSSVDGTDIIMKKYVNLGIAVALDDGLLVPVIRDADKKGLKELSIELKLLATDARAGRLGPDSLSGGTFTITNLGMFGIESFSPIINLPEVAILGVNAIREVVVPDCCGFTTKKFMGLSLTADHRVVDGSVAAQFLARLRKKLENPALLFI